MFQANFKLLFSNVVLFGIKEKVNELWISSIDSKQNEKEPPIQCLQKRESSYVWIIYRKNVSLVF